MDRPSLAGTNTLVLYNETQTYTATVHEHLAAFARFSRARVFFAHQDVLTPVTDFALFDTVIIHYSVRLPFDQIAEDTARALAACGGLKVLFIQDEYDHTHRAWHWIKRLGVELVFSSVPAGSMHRVYPPEQLPGVRFVSNLTGYAPEALATVQSHIPPSQRPLKIGYRGRPLPIRYGALGQEKVEIGRMVKAYCESAGVAHDIAWQETDRLYGDAWYDFIRSCRAVLGTESGSNVFDWDGTLANRTAEYKQQHPRASDSEIYDSVIAPLEQPGLMNQVSARVFEAIACRTALVLFEGSYSGVVEADRHFIPLRKDGSNLGEVIDRLRDGPAVDTMTERAWTEVLASGRYAHDVFIRMVDSEIAAALGGRDVRATLGPVTTALVSRSWPLRYQIVPPRKTMRLVRWLLPLFPAWLKDLVKQMLRSLLPRRH